jgi:hypothetical protein
LGLECGVEEEDGAGARVAAQLSVYDGAIVARLLFALAAFLALLVSGGYLQLFVAALILAFAVRLAYVLLRWRVRPRLLSGWIFVIALGLLVTAAAGSEGRHVRRANAAAVRQGVVAKGVHPTARARCVGLLLDWWDASEAQQPPEWTKPKFRLFAMGVCDRAAEEHVLRDDGRIESSARDRIWYGS